MLEARFLRIVTILIIASVTAAPATAQEWRDLEVSLEGRELVMRPTFEGRRKLYIDTPEGEAFLLHRGDDLFPLREPEQVHVVDVDPGNDKIELELQSSRHGRGRVEFHGAPPTPEEFEHWLDEVFELATPEADFHRFVGNRDSQRLHIRGANHLPPSSAREPFHSADDGIAAGYGWCGVCTAAVAQPFPNVYDYQTERSLAMLGLQQVRSMAPPADAELQAVVERVGQHVVDEWPVPLKGYDYTFQVLDSPIVNASAVPTGYIFVMRGLLEALETEEELEALLAHEIAHVEFRHSFRGWRNSQKTSFWTGIATAALGGYRPEPDAVTEMIAFTAGLFLAGHNRDREREADLFASYYLNSRGLGDGPLQSLHRKLKFHGEAGDPFGQGGSFGSFFATHPGIDERLDRAHETRTEPIPSDIVFRGVRNNGALVATLRFDVQRLYRNELDVVATLSATEALEEDDNVNTINLRVDGRAIELKERTAEKIFPGDEVSAVFRTDTARGLIEGPFSVSLKLRNVDRWERTEPAQDGTP